VRHSRTLSFVLFVAATLASAAQAQTRLLVGQITDDGTKLGIPGATIGIMNGGQPCARIRTVVIVSRFLPRRFACKSAHSVMRNKRLPSTQRRRRSA
jgi:hypothetical protein